MFLQKSTTPSYNPSQTGKRDTQSHNITFLSPSNNLSLKILLSLQDFIRNTLSLSFLPTPTTSPRYFVKTRCRPGVDVTSVTLISSWYNQTIKQSLRRMYIRSRKVDKRKVSKSSGTSDTPHHDYQHCHSVVNAVNHFWNGVVVVFWSE